MSDSLKRLAVYSLPAIAVGLACALFLQGCRASVIKPATDDEDRPPIIVRDGSAIFEDGDSWNPNKKSKPWKQVGSAKQWKPDQDGGHPVAGFTVYVAGFDPKDCPQSTLPGIDVQVQYTPALGQQPIMFEIKPTPVSAQNSKLEPELDSPSDLVPTANTDPPQIPYGDANGWISRVTVVDSNQGQKSCGFLQPSQNNPASAVRITIVSERK